MPCNALDAAFPLTVGLDAPTASAKRSIHASMMRPMSWPFMSLCTENSAMESCSRLMAIARRLCHRGIGGRGGRGRGGRRGGGMRREEGGEGKWWMRGKICKDVLPRGYIK